MELPSSASYANLRCLPYQPLEHLSASLSAADLQVVVMGEPFVGIIHPCKIYNILSVGSPMLYIGPTPSHGSDILGELNLHTGITVAHGEVDRCVGEIRRLAASLGSGEAKRQVISGRKYSQATLRPQLVAELERLGTVT
jgi:hypothetical protein